MHPCATIWGRQCSERPWKPPTVFFPQSNGASLQMLELTPTLFHTYCLPACPLLQGNKHYTCRHGNYKLIALAMISNMVLSRKILLLSNFRGGNNIHNQVFYKLQVSEILSGLRQLSSIASLLNSHNLLNFDMISCILWDFFCYCSKLGLLKLTWYSWNKLLMVTIFLYLLDLIC